MKIALLVAVLLANLNTVSASETRLLPPEFVAHCKEIGAELFAVAPTGSMKPTYDEHTVIGVQAVPFEKIRQGDVIMFMRDGRRVAHRAIEKKFGKWKTKGDALEVCDAVRVTPANYVGVVVASYKADERN